MTPIIALGEAAGIDMTFTKAVLSMIVQIENGELFANLEVLHGLHREKLKQQA